MDDVQTRLDDFVFHDVLIGVKRPLPQTLLLLKDARTLLQKRKLCPNDLCHERGSPQKLGTNREQIGNKLTEEQG